LRISQADAMRPADAAAPNMLGLFVGISDYPGEVNDLPYTASDATRVRDAMVRGVGLNPSDAVVLMDGDATRERFRMALADLARRSDERTTLVLFYSGHGSQVDRPGGPDAADPDGMDETISLYDGDVRDDELARMLDAFRAGGRQIVVLDACYSGGFSKDVVSRPGRMGFFSSEEDVLSAVADKFEAGGYLSLFFADALAAPNADEDRNGAVTALELSTYLRDRYEGDVRDEGPRTIRTGETRLDQQELVVDRGSVGPFDTVFTLR
ncbi:MAG TPA: caspase family protein, partial [Rhodothermales bacterium]|nr:caspase family protein [Rhodothermales bacterium]